MRVEGQDPILSLLKQLNQNNVNEKDNDSITKTEETLKEVERILKERDQVILHDKSEVAVIRYSKSPGESPELYLQRVAREISLQDKEVQERKKMQNSGYSMEDAMAKAALYHALPKKLQKDRAKQESVNMNISNRNKGLAILVAILLTTVVLYLLFNT